MQITHKSGRHKSKPFQIQRLEHGEWNVRFDETCRYNHRDNDQKDWNKLVGIKKCFFRPKRDSVMIAWRYNLETDKIELTAYVHENGGVYVAEEFVSVDINETVAIEIDWSWITIKDNPFPIMTTPYRGWLINSWFGGQKKAPHDITFVLERTL